MAEIGMQYPVWAEMETESTYKTGMVMGKAVSASLNWQKEDNELYGDDAVAETDQSLTGYTLDLSTTYLEEGVESAVLGYTETSGGEFEITDADPPYGGCGYIRVLKRNNTRLYKAVWYPKIQFGSPNETSNTKQRSISWGTPTISGKGLAVLNGSGKNRFRLQQVFTTLAGAKAYLDAKANISSGG